MQMLLGRLGGPYCHANACSLRPFSKGEMLSVFSLCVILCLVRCLLSFFCRSSFLRDAFWKNFRERTFVFGSLGRACVFWWVFATVFAFFFGVSLPELFGKILLMSGLVFFLGSFSLALVFVVSRRFFFFFFFETKIR